MSSPNSSLNSPMPGRAVNRLIPRSRGLRMGLGALIAALAIFAASLSPHSAAAVKKLMREAVSNIAGVTKPDASPRAAKPAKQSAQAARTVAANNPILGTAQMNIERHSHAAVRLGDGKILIIGGENSRGQVRESEIFNPATRRFATAANLDTARTEHTAAALADGRVLVVGGRNGAQPLRSTEIYDYNANGFSNGPQLNRPRAGHTATLLANGRILIAGGSADASAEVFDPATQTSTLTVGRMTAARSFHSAILLANGKVLIVGGTANGGAALTSAEIYDPATQRFTATNRQMLGARVKPALNRLPDGKVQVIGGDGEGTMEMFNVGGGYFTAYAHIASNPALLSTPGRAAIIRRARPRSAINPNEPNENAAQTTAAALASAADDPLDRDSSTMTDTGGETLVAGGEDSNNTTLNSALVTSNSTAAVSVDQTDYAPGDTVTVTGSGFGPNESVQLTFQRDNGTPDTVLTANTDADGNFTNADYVCQSTDAYVSFILTAVGQTSGLTAVTTFTDSPKVVTVSVGSQSAPNPVTAGNSATYTVSVIRGTGNDAFTASLTITGLPAGASGLFSPNPISFPSSNPSITLTSTLTVTTSAVSTPAGLTTFTVTGTKTGTPTDNASGTGTLNVAAACTPPSITAPPSSATRTVGDSQTFSVTATGTATLTYQWRKGGVNIGGATSSSYTINPVSVSDAGNYDVVVTNSCGSATSTPVAVLTVNKKTLTVTGITANNKVYDGNTTATLNTGGATLSGLVSGLTSVTLNTAGATGVFADKNVGTSKTVTVSGLTISGTDAANYNLTQPTTTANITALAITGSVTASNKVYDATTSATILTRTLSGVIAPDVVSYTGGTATFADKNAGTGKTVTATGLSLSGADAGNYTVNGTATTTADITALAITGSITASNKVYDGTTAATIATRTLVGVISGDTVNYTGGTATFADKNVGTGKTVTATGLSLSGVDAGNYTVNSIATTTANITALAITGSITANNKVYDATTAATIATRTLSGVLGADVVSYTGGTATFADKNVGTGKTVTAMGLSLSGADAGNYTVNTTASTTADITALAITGSVTAANKVYDATTAATIATRTLSGVIAPDVVSYTGGTASFADKNVGVGKTVTATGLSLSGADAGNYTVNSTASTTADITARSLTVTATGVNKVYDGTAVASVTLSDNRVAGDVFTDSYTSASFADKNVGIGKTVSVTGISISGIDASNYTVNTSTTTTANITALAITGSITAASKTYDGNTSATITSRTLAGVIGGDDVSYTGGTATFANKNVGTGKTVTATGLSLSGADAGNYTVNTTATTTADITALAITGSITAASKGYDGNTTAAILTRTLSGVIGGDAVTYTGGTATFDTKNVGTGKTVTGTGLSLSGTDAGNYTVNTTAITTADITARTLTITATGVNKVYDGTATATVTLADDRVAGDVFADSYTSASFADKNVGNGKPVSVSGISISGLDAGNYTFNTTAATTANITARALTVSATGQNKVYDGTAAATVTLSDNRVAGDVLTAAYTTATFANKNVGTGKTVSVSGISISGADAGNYTVNTTATTTADITALAITGSITASNKVYDGNTSAAIASRTLSGVIGGDFVTYTGGTATFDNKNVGTGKTVTGTGLSLAGGDAGNYTVNTTAITMANITAAALTITAVTNTKGYDGTTSASAIPTVAGLQGTDTVTGLSETYDNRNAGTGKTLSVATYTVNDGNSGNNYTVATTTNATGVINKAALTITALANTKGYDATTSAAAVPTVGGLQSGDTVTGLSETYDNKNVGAGKTLSVASYTVNDGNGGNNYTVTTVTNTTGVITAATTVGTVTVTPSSQQYSDKVTFVATLSPASILGVAPATTVTFFVGTQNVGMVSLVSGGGVLTGTLSNVALLEPSPFGTAPTGQMAPGNRTVTAVFGGVNPNFAVGSPTTTLNITQEDARAYYTGALYASTSSATSSTATVTLSATIKDITAETGDPAYDANAGDIRNATVTFVNRDASNAVLCTASVGLVSAGDTKTGTATCNWTANIGAADSAQYTVGVLVNNYYTRNSSTDNTVITVSKPLNDFITGGGYLVLTSSSGLKAGDVRSKNNFGFNVKYNKQGTNLQGNINTIIRRLESDNVVHVYQIKGNSMTSLSTNVATGKATFNGKASIQDITNPLAPIAVDGNATLQVVMTDKGEPGNLDTIAITVWNKTGGLWFASNWNGTATIEQLLGGGNLVVH